MDIQEIVAELRTERDQIDRAIASLQGQLSDGGARRAARTKPGGPGRGITTAGRKRLSEAMKRRWAERRAKSVKAISSASVSNKKRSGMSAAGRKRISEMMKKRWAERRKSGQKKLG